MRLIDADALIEAMKKTESEYENAMTCPSWWSAFNVISEQSTAYDIDKVVDELEEWTFNADINVGDGTIMNHDLIVSKNAIKIVKQGCASDDVCEAELLSGYKFFHKTSCGNTFDMGKGFKYCPYCGKKIKVVE